ncbi:hypothetical protein L1987_83274 [Smallanthus sonchifolius]|uniref:Uncharacterized protein n=1 Tax=Smallanthus sonchifolius TaxID=185202 RepID=A0ACB8YB67_9ASTR|nr:hypothetical protein L1987_83274 [Smallanthus sonchifolius]
MSIFGTSIATEEKSPIQQKGTSIVTKEKSLIQQMKQVYESIKSQERVNLFGPAGVGKTRMAKKVSDRAIKDKVFALTLWVFMCREYTLDSLTMSIARQLSIIPMNDEWEVEEDNKEQERDRDVDKGDQVANTPRQKIQTKLKESKNVLVILDDIVVDGKDKSSNEKKFWSAWEEMLSVVKEVNKEVVKEVDKEVNKEVNKEVDKEVDKKGDKEVDKEVDKKGDKKGDKEVNKEVVKEVKVKFSFLLISRKKKEDEDFTDQNSFEVKPVPREVSISLLKEKLDPELSEKIKIQNLGKRFIETFNGDLPGTVIMIAKVLNYFCHSVSGVSDLEKELEEASENNRLSKLLFKDDVLPIGVFKDLWWHGHHFFRDSGSVHYSELITYWILEGYLSVGSMPKLYKKGHGVLMDLIDCGVVKVQEGGHVSLDNSLIDRRDLYECVDRYPRLGLASVITSEAEGLGRVSHIKGMLKTTPTRREKKESKQSDEERSEESKQPKKCSEDLSTLLLDGTHATERDITEFVDTEKKLQVFGLFYPTIRALPKGLETIEKLRVLVLRGCEFLTNAKLSLKALEVLEISGARNLRRLNSGLFKDMLKLKSLHISELQIKSLPQAIYNLDNIQWLVVKDCPNLKKLESISKLAKLTIVDLSGNTSLDTLDKNFLKFEKLQSLNLSKTKVSTTPLLKNRRELTHLSCRGCSDLDRLRGLTSLTSLQTIDLSGSEKFEEFHDSSLESLSSLITLNLSGTRIDRLPSNISKPRYLYLRSCLDLKRLPCIVSFENLEELDLSGSSNLKQIDEKFFDKMSRVRVLNLSKTNISHLPSLSNVSSLRKLFLSHCHCLEDLPSLESATKLEILDASNCFALQEIQSKSFEAMTSLQKIDFSETKIMSLPPLPNPCNALQTLLLKNCNALQNLEITGRFSNLEELNLSGIKSLKDNGAEFVKDASNLRILDLSNTSIKQLPPISNLTNLTHLSLAGCMFSSEPKLDNELMKIEVLDLSRSSIKCLPKLDYKNLRKLLLKDCIIKETEVISKSTPSLPNLDYTNLQKLLLKHCSVKEITDDSISKFTRLVYIEYPDMNGKSSPEEVDQDHYNICNVSHIDKPPVFLSASQFLKINPLQQGQYHVCAVPDKVEGESWDTYLPRHELVFRDVYLKTSQFARYNDYKSLQLRGFDHFPKSIENIVKQIDLVFMIDYKLNLCFDPSMFNNIKGCWIERCNKMVTIFTEKEGNEIHLEDLGICNNIGLKSIYEGKQAFGSFDSLKSLYIDSCPELTNVLLESCPEPTNVLLDSKPEPTKVLLESKAEPTKVIPLSWLPKNLQVLEIKYCDKIFESGGELPGSLQTLKIWECPKVKQLEGEFEIPKGLKTLWISGAASLKNLVTKNNETINLVTLKVENCPILDHIISSSLQLPLIQIIEITSCEKIKTLCTDVKYQTWWNDLKKLHLEDLPLLKQIGANLLPTVYRFTRECPNLQIQIVD